MKSANTDKERELGEVRERVGTYLVLLGVHEENGDVFYKKTHIEVTTTLLLSRVKHHRRVI